MCTYATGILCRESFVDACLCTHVIGSTCMLVNPGRKELDPPNNDCISCVYIIDYIID